MHDRFTIAEALAVPCGVAAILAIGLAARPDAQALSPEFLYQRDYSFERMTATRVVHDADDDGPIGLTTYVWRPLKNDRREVVLFSHGSTAGLSTSPREPGGDAPPRPLVQFLVLRGYTVVAPARRGRGTSTGTYVEECAFYAGKCSSGDQVALTARGLSEASLDNFAVIDQLVLGKLVPPGSRIVLAGHSRGGFLSLIMAADRPAVVKGVVNFAGGWHGVNARMSAADYEPRIKEVTLRLREAAKKVTVPTIWIHADRDVFYDERARQEMLRAWRDGGGKVEYVFFADHQLPNPHAVHSAPALWGKQLEAFLSALDASDSGKH